MGAKLKLVIPLMCLMIGSSLIEDVKSKSLLAKSRKTRGLGFNPIKEGRKVVSVINDLTTLVLGVDGIINYVKDDKSEEEFKGNVTAKLNDIYKKIEHLDQGIVSLRASIGSNNIQLVEEISSKVDQVHIQGILEILNEIEVTYKHDFAQIQNLIDKYGPEAVKTYLEPIIGSDASMKNKLLKVVSAFKLQTDEYPYPVNNIFDLMIVQSTNEIRNHRECGGLSTYDKIFTFYENVLKTVTKGYTMIVLAYEYRKIKSPSEAELFKAEQEKYQQIIKEAIVAITDSVKYFLNSINKMKYTSTHACDPETWEEGVNFIRIKNYASIRATEVCEYPLQCDCIPSGNERKYGAEYIISKPCPLPFQNDGEFQLKYYEIKYSEFETSPDRIVVRKCSKLFKGSEMFNKCLYDKNSDPYFSIRKVSLERARCDGGNNHVMTSARFYEKDGFIGIEAQCGFLVGGKIDPDSVKWDTRNRDLHTRENPPYHVVLDWNVKSFNLDDIVLPEGELVTSVRFTQHYPDHYLSLEVEGRKIYDPKDNSLYNNKVLETKTYRPDEDRQGYRRELHIVKLPLANTQTSKTYEMSSPGKHFVKVSNSQEQYGIGSFASLVPLIDMSEYSLSQPLPLGGIGIMYKSVPGHAGFLSFKFISTKFTSYISPIYAERFNMTSKKTHYF